MDVAGALLLARSFAPLRAALTGRTRSRRCAVDPLRLGDVATIDPAVSWRPRPAADLLRVPIGIAEDGAALLLDLKESAHGGMGPHGLVVGATGSGKSELLRTLVTALAITHPPTTLALLLADFKGGATFSGLAELPHLAGIDHQPGGRPEPGRPVPGRAGRRAAAAAGIARRGRQADLGGRLLPNCGGAGRSWRPMPRLLVVVDEFSELLGARPDLTELFVTIGRIGRSIGIHLLLATQRLDTGRIRGLESHLSYRICLRTFSEAESREAIGSPDAYHLPPEPGSAYLRADSGGLRRFRAATLSTPYRSPMADARARRPPWCCPSARKRLAARISALRAALAGRVERFRRPGSRCETAPSGPDDAGRRDRADPAGRPGPAGGSARAPGLARPAACPVDARRTVGPQRVVGRGPDRVRAVLGLVDVPERQRQDPLRWDCSEGNGNLLIVGAGRSGKSTAAAPCCCRSPHGIHPPRCRSSASTRAATRCGPSARSRTWPRWPPGPTPS